MSEGTKAPSPMRFASTGEAQAAAVQNAGNATLSNPFASNTVTTGPDGRPMQSTQFAGGLGDAAAGLQQQAGGLGQAMDWSQFGQVGTGDDARNQAVNASYGQATSRLDPQWDKRMEAQRTQLLNQGFDPTSEGYKGAMQDLNFARNDAYGGAMNSAQMMGQQAGDSVFRNNLMGQQNSISNALRQRGQPLDEMSQLMGLAKFDPNRAMQSQMASTGILKDFMQSQYGQNWHQYDVDSGAAADAMQGGMQAGASGASALMALLPLLAASDERMKTNVIRHDAEALPGVPFASWDYLPEYGPAGRHAGVIAQDLEKVSPRHVFTRSSDGMRFVDYSFLKGDAHE